MKYFNFFSRLLTLVVLVSPHLGWSASDACQDFEAYATQGKDDKSLKTDTLMVLKGGKVAYEYYDGFFGPETPHCYFSASKSVTATLLGIAIRDGRVSLDQKLIEIFPEALAAHKGKKDEAEFSKITLRDFLYMSSGIKWAELDGLAMREQTGLKMLYTDGALDNLSFVFRQPMDPAGRGKIWSYSSGASNVIMAALQKAYGKDNAAFPWRELFDPLGMKNVTFARDKAGTYVGSAYVFTTLREMAKLGQLYLNDGVWDGKRILPEGWVDVVSKRSPATGAKATAASDIQNLGVYGGGFWVNQAVPEKNLAKPFPNAPSDMYYAAGHYGQFIFVIPSLDMVIVRTGHDMEFMTKLDGLLSRAQKCFSPKATSPTVSTQVIDGGVQ
jgi:CubicO group peptidase (beta-lactamase class C family)